MAQPKLALAQLKAWQCGPPTNATPIMPDPAPDQPSGAPVLGQAEGAWLGVAGLRGSAGHGMQCSSGIGSAVRA